METVTGLSLLPDNVEDGVDELSTLCVVTLGPIVSSTSLAKHEVVRAEDLPIRTGANGVHRSRLEIHQNGAGNVTACSDAIL